MPKCPSLCIKRVPSYFTGSIMRCIYCITRGVYVHFTEQALPLNNMIKFNSIFFIVSYPLAWMLWTGIPLKSYIAGYILCSLNFWALTYLGYLLVQSVASNTKAINHVKGLTITLGIVKFIFFIASISFMIKVLSFSAIHIFIGSLLALILTASFMSYTFLRYVKRLQRKQELKHAQIVAQRLKNSVSELAENVL